jgi:hypothetical protein
LLVFLLELLFDLEDGFDTFLWNVSGLALSYTALVLLLTANGFSPGGSGTTIRQQTNNTLTTIRQHTI